MSNQSTIAADIIAQLRGRSLHPGHRVHDRLSADVHRRPGEDAARGLCGVGPEDHHRARGIQQRADRWGAPRRPAVGHHLRKDGLRVRHAAGGCERSILWKPSSKTFAPGSRDRGSSPAYGTARNRRPSSATTTSANSTRAAGSSCPSSSPSSRTGEQADARQDGKLHRLEGAAPLARSLEQWKQSDVKVKAGSSSGRGCLAPSSSWTTTNKILKKVMAPALQKASDQLAAIEKSSTQGVSDSGLLGQSMGRPRSRSTRRRFAATSPAGRGGASARWSPQRPKRGTGKETHTHGQEAGHGRIRLSELTGSHSVIRKNPVAYTHHLHSGRSAIFRPAATRRFPC